MAVSKVQLADGTVLVDLTSTSVTANTLASGATAIGKDGNTINGALSFVHGYTGSTAPASSLGVNGDYYFQRG